MRCDHVRCYRAAVTPNLTRLLIVALLASPYACAQTAGAKTDYEFAYQAHFDPQARRADVTIALTQRQGVVSELNLAAPPARYLEPRADGEIDRDGDRLLWRPPPDGGTLRFQYTIDHKRRDGDYDARITDTWTIVRLEDLFPPARSKARKGASGRSVLRLGAPDSWAIETPYGRAAGETIDLPHERTYDRPAGWVVAGEIGIRREQVAGREVAIAAPKDHGMRRMDMMAFLNWNLPELTKLLPAFPQHLLIAGAGPGFWRGGLSGPSSLYVHADRPLISENGTSTLLHELIHVGTSMHAADDADWLVEGIAEYYSLEIMRRSGTISDYRFQQALDSLREWGEDADAISARRSSGAVTAKATVLLHALADEIGAAEFDRIARKLATLDRGIVADDLFSEVPDADDSVAVAAIRAAL